jgi:hypothetical protein
MDWQDVPGRVVQLLKCAAPLARELRLLEPVGDPGDLAWWDPATGRVHVMSPRKQASWRAATVPGVEVSAAPPGGDVDWVLVKRAQFLAPLSALQHGAQRALGGPHPLASAITGGLLGAGLGYGAGWVGEKFLPEGEFERGRLRRNLAMLGGGLGALPGAMTGLAQARIPEAGGSAAPGAAKFLSPAPWLSDYSWRNPLFKGAAAEFASDAGVAHMPSIPVDAFNRAIWNDVGAAPNPFGTKSPWGDDSQPLRTPPRVASFASGIVSGAGAATGQGRVSPFQVASAAALAAGTGLAAGIVVGKVFGALAGLSPDAQRRLQRTGVWAGLVGGAVHSLFAR